MGAAVAVHGGTRAGARAPAPLVLWAIGIAGVALATATIVFGRMRDASEVQVALLVWISAPYILAGCVAWWRRPDSRLGVLMIAGGFVSGLSALQLSQHELLLTIGSVFDILPAALFLHVYLAFPDGRLRSRFERMLVSSAYAIAIGVQLVKLMLGVFPNSLEVVSRPELAIWLERVQLVSLAAICLAGIGVLAARHRREGAPRRRSLTLLIDSFALGLVMIAVLFVVGAIPALSSAFQPIQRATLFVIGISPVVFLLGLLDARLARSAVGDLVIELRSDLPPTELRHAIARTLRDPTLTLAYWLPAFDAYADLDGHALEVPGPGRSATLIDRNGEHVAALLHDPALDDEPELLAAVGAAAGIALENARLQAELAARLEEVRGSRARAIEAGQEERKRLERNLHDGAQQRLVALSLHLSLLERQLKENPDAGRRLDEAQRELALSLEELRDLARGIHPAVLTGHGLGVALEHVAARAPVPVELTVELGDRLPEPVEVAAYYVVTECLANMAKHAEATSATVGIVLAGGDVVVEVADDGIGGANTEGGSGLRGLADRVEALGGRLRVWTPQGGGTRVRAEIPCE